MNRFWLQEPRSSLQRPHPEEPPFAALVGSLLRRAALGRWSAEHRILAGASPRSVERPQLSLHLLPLLGPSV